MHSLPCDTKKLALQIRRDALRMVHHANASHIGSCLSIADLLAVLYGRILNTRPAEPNFRERDRFILSKGHAAAALYAVLANRGFFSRELLKGYCQAATPFVGHVSHGVPGVEFSTGSLGHGLSIGLGVALAAQMDRVPSRAFVLLSDGECDEGSIWEAALFAGHHKAANLIALIDYNKIQSFGRVDEVLDLEPFVDKWRAMRWMVREVDGHNHVALLDALGTMRSEDSKPTVLICHTIKGKGVSFMEDKLEWHYKSPTKAQLLQALAELENAP